MKSSIVALGFLFLSFCFGLSASAETLHYVDYEGIKHKAEITINDGSLLDQLLKPSSKILLEDFKNIELKLSPLKTDDGAPTKAYGNSDVPSGVFSSSMNQASLLGVMVSLGKDAAQASRQDIQSMLNAGMIVNNPSIEKLCPLNARGSIVIGIRDFGYLNYCLVD